MKNESNPIASINPADTVQKALPSEYVAQSGHYKNVTEKFETLLPPRSRCKTVFITDGASWITNWLTTTYPESLQILNFFHVCEKLATVPQLIACKKDWFEHHKALLLAGSLDVVCSSIKQLTKFDGQTEWVQFNLSHDESIINNWWLTASKLAFGDDGNQRVIQARIRHNQHTLRS